MIEGIKVLQAALAEKKKEHEKILSQVREGQSLLYVMLKDIGELETAIDILEATE